MSESDNYQEALERATAFLEKAYLRREGLDDFEESAEDGGEA